MTSVTATKNSNFSLILVKSWICTTSTCFLQNRAATFHTDSIKTRSWATILMIKAKMGGILAKLLTWTQSPDHWRVVASQSTYLSSLNANMGRRKRSDTNRTLNALNFSKGDKDEANKRVKIELTSTVSSTSLSSVRAMQNGSILILNHCEKIYFSEMRWRLSNQFPWQRCDGLQIDPIGSWMHIKTQW